MMALERQGVEIEIASIHAPPTSFRHAAPADLKGEIFYAPPQPILKLWEDAARRDGRWPAALIAEHEQRYGADCKASLRARNALLFADRFRRQGIQHVHAHFANRAAHTAIFIKKLSGIPFSLTAHAQDFMVELGSNKELFREMCREAAFVVAVSEYSQKLLCELCPESRDKIIHLYNGIDLDRFECAPPPEDGGDLRILSVGRLIEFKGFQHLIAACSRLRDRGVPFACQIAGEGPMRDVLEQQIARAGLDVQVRLIGVVPQEEVARLLAACDVFVLACTVDGSGAYDVLPTVILEAMAAGRPVISTRLAGVPEMVADGENGLLVSPGSEEELANAIAIMAGDSALRRALGHAGRVRAEATFKVEHTSALLKEAFAKTLAPTGLKMSSDSVEPVALLYLVDQWPQAAGSAMEEELSQARADGTPMKVYACRTGSMLALEPNVGGSTFQEIEFLPEDVVLEAEWTERQAEAAKMEDWRAELGSDLTRQVFLEHARYAVYLLKVARRLDVRHVHAGSSRALLCAWLLRKMRGQLTLSASFENTLALPLSCVQKLSAYCVGGRLGEPEANLPRGAMPAFARAQPAGILQRVSRAFGWRRPPVVCPVLDQQATEMPRS